MADNAAATAAAVAAAVVVDVDVVAAWLLISVDGVLLFVATWPPFDARACCCCSRAAAAISHSIPSDD